VDPIDPTFRQRVTDVIIDKDAHQSKLVPTVFPNATIQYDLNHWCLATGKNMKKHLFPQTQGHELVWLASNLPRWAIRSAIQAREYARAGIPVPSRPPPKIPDVHSATDELLGRPKEDDVDYLTKLQAYIKKVAITSITEKKHARSVAAKATQSSTNSSAPDRMTVTAAPGPLVVMKVEHEFSAPAPRPRTTTNPTAAAEKKERATERTKKREEKKQEKEAKRKQAVEKKLSKRAKKEGKFGIGQPRLDKQAAFEARLSQDERSDAESESHDHDQSTNISDSGTRSGDRTGSGSEVDLTGPMVEDDEADNPTPAVPATAVMESVAAAPAAAATVARAAAPAAHAHAAAAAAPITAAIPVPPQAVDPIQALTIKHFQYSMQFAATHYLTSKCRDDCPCYGLPLTTSDSIPSTSIRLTDSSSLSMTSSSSSSSSPATVTGAVSSNPNTPRQSSKDVANTEKKYLDTNNPKHREFLYSFMQVIKGLIVEAHQFAHGYSTSPAEAFHNLRSPRPLPLPISLTCCCMHRIAPCTSLHRLDVSC